MQAISEPLLPLAPLAIRMKLRRSLYARSVIV
jgi:hypothetical protein